jgi:hypothetical protein
MGRRGKNIGKQRKVTIRKRQKSKEREGEV